MSDLVLANVEALASGEIDPMCPDGCISGSEGCGCNGIWSDSWDPYYWGDRE